MQLTNHVNISYLYFLLSLLILLTSTVKPHVKHLRVGKNLRQQEVK